MKTIIYTLISAAALIMVCAGCEREIMSYEGSESVWFAQQTGPTWGNELTWPYFSHTEISLVITKEDVLTVNIRVKATGEAKSYDRKFIVEVDTDRTTALEGIEFELTNKQITIPAGALVGYVPVVIRRTERMQEQVVDLGLKLVPNEDFTITFPIWGPAPGQETTATDVEIERGYDSSKHLLNISDIYVQPPRWLGAINQTSGLFEEANVFGVFTPKKFKLLCEVCDLEYSLFMDAETMSNGMMPLYGRRLAIYLMEEYQAKRAIVEDDGRLMWCRGCPWISIPGVAWDGIYVNYPLDGIFFD